MQNHLVLFGRPLSFDLPYTDILSVSGNLPGYTSSVAYTGTLSINNKHGKAKVEVLDSDMPNGWAVRVDNVQSKVVVTWPAYDETPATLHNVANGGFDSDANWDFGPGWSAFNGYGYEDNTAARYLDWSGTGISVGSPVPYDGNKIINLGCWVQQGANSKHHAGASCFLRWYDLAGNVLKDDYSEVVDSGKGGNWNETRISARGPADARRVSPGISGFRNSGNKEVWVDSVNWDYKYSQGVDTAVKTFTLSLKVTDSENRVAFWSGTIVPFGQRDNLILAGGGSGTYFMVWKASEGMIVQPTEIKDGDSSLAISIMDYNGVYVGTPERRFKFNLDELGSDFRGSNYGPSNPYGVMVTPDGDVITSANSSPLAVTQYPEGGGGGHAVEYSFQGIGPSRNGHKSALHPDGKTFLLTSIDGWGVGTWNKSAQLPTFSFVTIPYNGEPWGVDWHPTGNFAAMVTTDEVSFFSWNGSSMTKLGRTDTNTITNVWRSVKWSPSGTKVAVISYRTVRLYEWSNSTGLGSLIQEFIPNMSDNERIDGKFADDGTALFLVGSTAGASPAIIGVNYSDDSGFGERITINSPTVTGWSGIA